MARATDEGQDFDKRTVGLIAGTLLVLLVFIFAYALPRYHANLRLSQQIQQLQTVRQQLGGLLPEALRLKRTVPTPRPTVRDWITSKALGGIASKLVSNDSYANGRGSQIKLRKLTPFQTARFLTDLTRVDLVLQRVSLQDWDADGNWDLDAMVEEPKQP